MPSSVLLNPVPLAVRNFVPSIKRLRCQVSGSKTGWTPKISQVRCAVVYISQSFSLPKLYTPPGSAMAWGRHSTASRT